MLLRQEPPAMRTELWIDEAGIALVSLVLYTIQ